MLYIEIRTAQLRDEDILRLVRTATKAFSRRDIAILALLIDEGCFVNTIRQLKITDVDFLTGELQTRKSNQVIRLSEPSLNHLASYVAFERLPLSPYLFHTEKGKQLMAKDINQILKKIARKAGMEQVTPPILLLHNFYRSLQKYPVATLTARLRKGLSLIPEH